LKPLITLAPIGVVAGIVAALVFRFTTNRAAIRRVTNRMLAHVLEFQLFWNEPAVVLRAQRDLVTANLQLLRLLALPCLLLALPSYFGIRFLDGIYGYAPLPAGHPAVVTAARDIALQMPAGIVVETPPVHVAGEVSWRVRPSVEVPVALLRRTNAQLRIPFPAATILHLHWIVWFFLFSSAGAIGWRCLA
jgi:hypothetical protein